MNPGLQVSVFSYLQTISTSKTNTMLDENKFIKNKLSNICENKESGIKMNTFV